jgi:hypothetical protein
VKLDSGFFAQRTAKDTLAPQLHCEKHTIPVVNRERAA